MIRLFILAPLGVFFGACAATVALFILGANVPEFGSAFIGAIVSAWRAAWRALIEADDPDAVTQVFQRGGLLAAMALIAPVALAAIIAEIVRLRGALLHIVLTGALTILLPFASVALSRAPTQSEARALACLFFTGSAAGLVYWLIAGRGREPVPPAPEERRDDRQNRSRFS